MEDNGGSVTVETNANGDTITTTRRADGTLKTIVRQDGSNTRN